MADFIRNVFTISPGAFWDPGSYNAPHVTDAGLRFQVDLNDQAAPSAKLQEAYNTLGPEGGTIEIWPSVNAAGQKASYVFNGPVDFRKKEVRIIQHIGANIEHHNSLTSSVFRVQCPFEWYGLRAKYDVTKQAVPGRSLFLVNALDLVKNNSGSAAVITSSNTNSTFSRNQGSFIQDGVEIGSYLWNTGFPTGNGPWLVTSIDPGGSIVGVRNLGNNMPADGTTGTLYYANDCNDFTLKNARVSWAYAADNVNGGVYHYTVVNAQGPAGDFQMGGVNIDDATIEIRNAQRDGSVPTQPLTAWPVPGDTPSGFGLLRAKNCRAVRVGNITYRGQSYENSIPQYGAGPLIYHEGCMVCIYGNIIVTDLNFVAQDGTATPIWYSKPSAGAEGGHCTINGMEIEHVGTSHIVEDVGSAWIKINNVFAGRMTPNVMTSAFKFLGGQNMHISKCGTHNPPGPSFTGTVAVSGTLVTPTSGQNYLKHLKAGDRIRFEGWTAGLAGNNRIMEIATVGSTTFTTTKAFLANGSQAGVTMTMQAWVADFEDVMRGSVTNMHNTLRKSDAKPYRFKGCKGVWRDPLEVIDTSQRNP